MVKLALLLFGACLSISSSIASPAADASSGVSCAQYKPVGWKSAKAKINFYDNNPSDEPANGHGFHAPTLPANASAINPWALSNHNTSTGSSFTFKACNVSSLGLTSPSTQSSCSHGGCYITYTNYIQVINPATGHCLTIPPGKNATTLKLDFRPCVKDIKDKSQLYETDQQVLYSPGYGSITSYGTVEFNTLDRDGLTPPFLAWVLDRSNNRTIEVMQYDYTQDGLSAKLQAV